LRKEKWKNKKDLNQDLDLKKENKDHRREKYLNKKEGNIIVPDRDIPEVGLDLTGRGPKNQEKDLLLCRN
jgi:hypothetical protein